MPEALLKTTQQRGSQFPPQGSQGERTARFWKTLEQQLGGGVSLGDTPGKGRRSRCIVHHKAGNKQRRGIRESKGGRCTPRAGAKIAHGGLNQFLLRSTIRGNTSRKTGNLWPVTMGLDQHLRQSAGDLDQPRGCLTLNANKIPTNPTLNLPGQALRVNHEAHAIQQS